MKKIFEAEEESNKLGSKQTNYLLIVARKNKMGIEKLSCAEHYKT